MTTFHNITLDNFCSDLLDVSFLVIDFREAYSCAVRKIRCLNARSLEFSFLVIILTLMTNISICFAFDFDLITSLPKKNEPPKQPPPAPMGVFGVDMPTAGKMTLIGGQVFTNLSGQLIGSRSVSSQFVVATTPWFVDPTKNVRLVPQNIAVSAQNAIIAYGINDKLSAVITATVSEKQLEALTFRGPSGIIPLGRSYPGTAGLADVTTNAIYRAYQDSIHRFQFNIGLAFPFSINTDKVTLLQPDGTYATVRAFYGMQPGARTFDIMPGIVYAGHHDKWSWGASYRGRFPLFSNPQGWRFGDLHEFNGWGGFSFSHGITATCRVVATTQGQIRGYDPQIIGRAVPTNPSFYGGQRVETFGGLIISGNPYGYENISIATEAGLPIFQYLNGPQIRKNWQVGISFRVKHQGIYEEIPLFAE